MQVMAPQSRLLYGCMGLGGSWADGSYGAAEIDGAERAVAAALDAGITRFDHADIYRRGSAEAVFGEVLRRAPDLRDRITLQSKVGIRLAEPGVGQHYDLSGEAIRTGVRRSLERLGTDRLDVLLLHRPDPLMDPAEVATAVADLRSEGLVGQVGVSNMSSAQIESLQDALGTPVVADQLEMSLARHGFVDAGVLVNHAEGIGVDFPHGTLEHCSRHSIELQAWGALAGGRYTGAPTADPNDIATAETVARLARAYDVPGEAVVLGWLMRHPARISPVIGTTDPGRIAACAQAAAVAVRMTRLDWYELHVTARGAPLP